MRLRRRAGGGAHPHHAAGLEATRVIRSMERKDCRTIPIIAMSANAFDDDLKKSVECGMNGHLSKPVEVEKLYHILDQVLRQR